eukprot:scaffold4847_cov89-Cylindrotheca_fusiformis.AAC.13
MNLSIATFYALLLLVQSQQVRSQSNLLRQGGGGNAVGNPSSPFEVNTVRKQNIIDSEDVAPPSSHRLLDASYWEQVATFGKLGDTRRGGDRVSISGDGSLLAAAPGSYSGNTLAGIVQFFQKQEDGGWKENTDLRLLGVDTADYFGSDVSLSGNGQRVAIGAYGDDGPNGEADGLDDSKRDSGSVSIYEMSDGTWGEPLQVIHGEAAVDRSGLSVALSKDGTTLAIGAFSNDGNGDRSGHVRVYRWDTGTSSFKQMGEDIDGEAAGEIGAIHANVDRGLVRVFYWKVDGINGTDGSWKQRGSTIVGNAENDVFGYSVVVSEDGKILAVGAGTGQYAKVFQWKDSNEDNDVWEQIGESVTSDAQSLGLQFPCLLRLLLIPQLLLLVRDILRTHTNWAAMVNRGKNWLTRFRVAKCHSPMMDKHSQLEIQMALVT